MAQLLGPDQGSRLAYRLVSGDILGAAGRVATVYTAETGGALAAINVYDGTATPGALIAGSVLTVDQYSQLPLFWFPDSVDTVWVAIGTGIRHRVRADYDARIDAIIVGAGGVLPSRQVIAGTGLTGGGDLSADRTFAVVYGTGAGTAAQGNDSRIVNAASAADVTAAIAAHAAASDPHGDRAYALQAIKNRGVVTVGFNSDCDYVCDGTADDVQINAAVAAVGAAGGGTVQLQEDNFSTAATLTNTQYSNVRLVGRGIGVTTITCAASMTGNTPALDWGSTTFGTARALTVNTVLGDFTVTMSSGDAATFAVNDWVLLKSTKQTDSEDVNKLAGEIHQVMSIASGVVTLTDTVKDAYTTADTAQLVKLTVLHNIELSDFSITTSAPTSTLTQGFMHLRYINNLLVKRVEMHDAYVGMQVVSCVNSTIEKCPIYNINDVTPNANLRYGIWVASASQNVLVSKCQFRRTRHAVTTAGSSGSNRNGVQRGIMVLGCTSVESDTAHFDTHESADGVSFINCVAIGGHPYLDAADAIMGMQVRAANVSILNCQIKNVPGRGIMVFGTRARGTTIVGNLIEGIGYTFGTTNDAYGIYNDTAATAISNITGNTIRNCRNRGIYLSSGTDWDIRNNTIDNCPNADGPAGGVSIRLDGTTRVSIRGNRIINNSKGRPIQTASGADGTEVVGNTFFNNSNNAPLLVGVANSVSDNVGHNPQRTYAHGNITGAITVTRVNGDIQTGTLTGNITPTFTNGLNVGDRLTLVLAQDATGSRTWTPPGNVALAGGALVLSTTGLAVDTVSFVWDGTNWQETARKLATLAEVYSNRTITAGTGLTGGGDLSANRTLTVAYGTGAGTAAEGNDTRIVGAAANANVQEFTSSGTFTVPAGAIACQVYAIGGASGGGSGRRGASLSVRCGGGGGAGGAVTRVTLPASMLGASVTVTIGTGGAGGAAVTANDTNGNTGSAGTSTTFGTFVRAGGSLNGGAGGTGALGSGASGGVGLTNGGSGGTASTTGGSPGTTPSGQSSGGGGCGGGITTVDGANNGGAGSSAFYVNSTSGGSGGVVDTTAPAVGVSNGSPGSPLAGGGGGGGAASNTTTGQTGAAGGAYGGGGGGGGASLNGNNSGAGGAGAAGYMQVITYF